MVGGAFDERFEGVARVEPHRRAAPAAGPGGGWRSYVGALRVEFDGKRRGLGGQRGIHVVGGVCLHVDKQFAIGCTHFVERIAYE